MREKSSSSIRNSSCSPIQFTPQRISPVSLDSLSSKLRTNSKSPETTMKRDIAVGSTRIHVRSVGTNTLNTKSVDEAIYTKEELDEIIELAIEEYELQRNEILQRTLVSVGTQMIPEKLKSFNVGTQTIKDPVPQNSVSISVSPKTNNASTITDKICCENCSKDKVDNISLKDLDTKSKKIIMKTTGTQYRATVSNISTQCYPQVSSIGIQNVPQNSSQSTQLSQDSSSKQTDTKDLLRTRNSFTNTSLERPKIKDLVNSSTNTDVIKIKDSSVNTMSPVSVKHEGSNTDSVRFKESTNVRNTSSNTDIIKTKELGINTIAPPKMRTAFTNTDLLQSLSTITKVFKSNSSSNTEKVRTHEFGVNTHSPSLQHNSSNTEVISRKDIGCGDIVKPHISIACADNYCDSCKDAIKNLAKEFVKVSNSNSSLSSSSPKESKIPRALPSPKQPRKTFMRQNTYTVSSSGSSSSPSPSRKLVR